MLAKQAARAEEAANGIPKPVTIVGSDGPISVKADVALPVRHERPESAKATESIKTPKSPTNSVRRNAKRPK